MAKIQDLNDKDGNIVYPTTVGSAVYLDKNTRLDNKLKTGVYVSETQGDHETVVEDIDTIPEDDVTKLENRIANISNRVSSVENSLGGVNTVVATHTPHRYICGTLDEFKVFLKSNALNTTFGIFSVENPDLLFGESGTLIGQYVGDGSGKFMFTIVNYNTGSLWTGSFSTLENNTDWVLIKK